MKAIRLVLLAAILIPGAAAAQMRERINVPSDPRATYLALRIAPLANGQVEVLTQRTGPSGVSFALRLVDCRGRRFAYLGEGDTEAQASAARGRSAALSPLVPGSISDAVATFACDPTRRR